MMGLIFFVILLLWVITCRIMLLGNLWIDNLTRCQVFNLYCLFGIVNFIHQYDIAQKETERTSNRPLVKAF